MFSIASVTLGLHLTQRELITVDLDCSCITASSFSVSCKSSVYLWGFGTALCRLFLQSSQLRVGADSGACLSAFPFSWGGMSLLFVLVAPQLSILRPPYNISEPFFPVPSSASHMIRRSLFERLRWVWTGARGGCDPSSANIAVNYHWSSQQVHHTMVIVHNVVLCVPCVLKIQCKDPLESVH